MGYPLLCPSLQHLVLSNVLDGIVINDPPLLLEAVHEALVTDLIDLPGNAAGQPVYLVDCPFTEDVLIAAGVLQVGRDILFRFSTVQMRERAVDINALPYRVVSAVPQLLIPECCATF